MAIHIQEWNDMESGDFPTPAWSALLERTQPRTPFSEPSYLALWCRMLGGEAKLRVITASRGGDLIGCAPFMVTVDPVGPVSLSTLKFLGNNIGYPGDVLYTDITATEPRADIVRAMLLYAKAQLKASRWDFGYLHPHSPTFRVAREMLGLSGPDSVSSQPYVTLTLPSDERAYIRSLSLNVRQNYKRRSNKLAKIGPTHLSVDSKPDAVRRRIEELIRNHLRWWAGTPKESWFGDGRVHRFMASAAELLAGRGQYLVSTLECGGTPIAWSAGAFDQNTYFEQYVGYDRSFSECSPGMLVSVALAGHLMSQDVHRVELGPGFDERKRGLGGTPQEYARVQGYPGWVRRVAELSRVWSGRRAPT